MRPPWWRPFARARWDDDTRTAVALAKALGPFCTFCTGGHNVADCDALTRHPEEKP